MFLLVAGLHAPPAGTTVLDDIRESLQRANVNDVSNYFAVNLEAEIHGMTPGRISAAQVEEQLGSFLTEYPPKNVAIRHRGPDSEKTYGVYSYESRNGTVFRITVYLHNSGEGWRIHELKVEKS